MDSDTIRKTWKIGDLRPEDVPYIQVQIAAEIAAQLAELNERIDFVTRSNGKICVDAD